MMNISYEKKPTDPDDWYVSCSDDEKYTKSGCERGKLKWTPDPEDVIRLFQTLDKVWKNFLILEIFLLFKYFLS